MVIFLGIGIVGSWTIARGRRRVLAMGGYACPNCLFDLSGDAVERCGECGQHVMHSALPELWAKQRNFRRPGKKEYLRMGFDKRGLSSFEAGLRQNQLLVGIVIIIPWIGSQFLAEYLETAVGGSSSSWMIPVFIVGLIVIVGPYGVFLWKKTARLKGSLRESGGMSCPRCLHDLSGAEVDRCPECEQMVEYATLGQKWAVRMKVLKIE